MGAGIKGHTLVDGLGLQVEDAALLAEGEAAGLLRDECDGVAFV